MSQDKMLEAAKVLVEVFGPQIGEGMSDLERRMDAYLMNRIEQLERSNKELDQENRHLLEELEDKKEADEALIAVEVALDPCGLTGTYAAQIEKLKAQNKELREALQSIIENNEVQIGDFLRAHEALSAAQK